MPIGEIAGRDDDLVAADALAIDHQKRIGEGEAAAEGVPDDERRGVDLQDVEQPPQYGRAAR